MKLPLGTETEALAQYERLKSELTQKETASCLSSELCHAAEVEVPIADIIPSKENEQLYRAIVLSDPDIQSLADSIRRHGVLERCIVTADRPHRLISGHRRLVASEIASRTSVPCRLLNVQWGKLTSDERLSLIRECNRYRHKSVSEQIREEILDTDPAEAEHNLQVQRNLSVNRPEWRDIETLNIEGTKKRHRISGQKADHVKFIKQVVFEERRDYWPLSVRGIHYPLLNHKFFRNIPRRLWYLNDDNSYQSTSDLCTRLRLLGEIPWEAIDDGTRPLKEFRAYSDARHFVRQEMRNLLTGYWRNLLQTQPNYVEVLVEKNTIYHMALRVTEKYQIPTISARGFCSIDPWHDLYQRYLAS